jgi:hypothetical protein
VYSVTPAFWSLMTSLSSGTYLYEKERIKTIRSFLSPPAWRLAVIHFAAYGLKATFTHLYW